MRWAVSGSPDGALIVVDYLKFTLLGTMFLRFKLERV